MRRKTIALIAALGFITAHAHAATEGPAALTVSAAATASEYVFAKLPLHEVTAINAYGVAAGRYETDAAIVDKGVRTLLPRIEGFAKFRATGISSSGQIIGYATNSDDGPFVALLWPTATSAPVVITGPGTIHTYPSAINSDGVVVGWTMSGTRQVGFRWTKSGGMTVLSVPDSTSTRVVDISNSGYAVAEVNFPGELRTQAWRFFPDNSSRIVSRPGNTNRILENGGVFGFGPQDLTHWSLTNTPTLFPSDLTIFDIAPLGRTVGYLVGTDGNIHPATRTTLAAPLAELPTPVGSRGYATKTNACGNIVGALVLPTGEEQPVMWSKTICDGPSTTIVPDVRRTTMTQAAATLFQSNLFAGKTTFVVGPCADVGLVSGQSPVPQTQAVIASSVDFTFTTSCNVSTPNVLGLSLNSAASTVRQVGLVIGQVRYLADRTCNNIGTVMSQTPSFGTIVNWGSPVNVVIGTRPSTPCR